MQISALECASLRTPTEREPQQKDYITKYLSIGKPLNEIKNHYLFSCFVRVRQTAFISTNIENYIIFIK